MKKLLYSQMESENKRQKFHQINMILLKIRLQDLSGENYYDKKDLDDLTDYLFSVEYWGYYELLIFMNTLDVLNHDVFMVLAREMSRRSDFYKEIPNNRRLISTMLLNAYITCIEREKFIDALYFEKLLNQCFFIETEIYERLVFKYAQNLYLYKKERNSNAVTEMKNCITAIQLAGSNSLAKTYEGHLKKNLAEDSQQAYMGKKVSVFYILVNLVGLLSTSVFVGMILGNICTAFLTKKLSIRTAILVSNMANLTISFGILFSDYSLILFGAFGSAFFMGIINPKLQELFFKQVPEDKMGAIESGLGFLITCIGSLLSMFMVFIATQHTELSAYLSMGILVFSSFLLVRIKSDV